MFLVQYGYMSEKGATILYTVAFPTKKAADRAARSHSGVWGRILLTAKQKLKEDPTYIQQLTFPQAIKLNYLNSLKSAFIDVIEVEAVKDGYVTMPDISRATGLSHLVDIPPKRAIQFEPPTVDQIFSNQENLVEV